MNTRRARTHADGIPYDEEETEFILAVERWKRTTGVKFPALTDLLKILKELGWRKTEIDDGRRTEGGAGTERGCGDLP